MRNKRLDVLRCVAVLLVLFRHVGIPLRIVNPGWAGVDLFFVLSGFLISGLLFSEYKQRHTISFKRFFVRRGFKIYPAFYVFLFITSIVRSVFHNRGSVQQFISEILYIQNYSDGLWRHTWSLAVEEHFYILLPIFLLLLIRYSSNRTDPFRAIPFAFFVVASTCLAFRIVTVARIPLVNLQEWSAYRAVLTPTHERIDSLFFGVLLGYVHHFRLAFFEKLLASTRNRLTLALLAVVLICPTLVLAPENCFTLTVGLSMLYVGFGIILVLCLHVYDVFPGGIAIFLGRVGSVFAFVGMYSYSIYLWHDCVLPWGPGLVRRVFHVQVKGPFLFLFYFLVSVILGILMSRSIEYPALRLRDRLFPALQSPVAVKTPPPQLPTFWARLWPVIVELWIAGILATFFIVRILGSQTGQRILGGLLHHTRP